MPLKKKRQYLFIKKSSKPRIQKLKRNLTNFRNRCFSKRKRSESSKTKLKLMRSKYGKHTETGISILIRFRTSNIKYSSLSKAERLRFRLKKEIYLRKYRT